MEEELEEGMRYRRRRPSNTLKKRHILSASLGGY